MTALQDGQGRMDGSYKTYYALSITLGRSSWVAAQKKSAKRVIQDRIEDREIQAFLHTIHGDVVIAIIMGTIVYQKLTRSTPPTNTTNTTNFSNFHGIVVKTDKSLTSFERDSPLLRSCIRTI